ncbi:MAG: glycosyltransferase family 4 protein [bacterium]|nr:glycosyltransferase family 4 protein [bacterium]
MKFFFFSPEIYSLINGSETIGGSELQQFILINSLLDKQHKVVICTKTAEITKYSKYKLISFPYNKRILKYFYFFGSLVRENPDVICLRSPSNMAIVMGIYGLIFRKKMVYFAASDVDFDIESSVKKFNRTCFRIFIKMTKYIFVQNNNQMALLKKYYNKQGVLNKSLIEIRNNGSNDGDAEKKKFFLWVGRMVPLKRLELLIETAGKMPSENFVVIAPYTTRNKYVDDIIRMMSDQENIIYHRFVKRSLINNFYMEAKGLISTSTHEGFSNTFLEAWNNSVPVYTLGIDPDNLIKNAHGKLGAVFSSVDELVKSINRRVIHKDPEFMNKYITDNHGIDKNVEFLLGKLSC